VPGPSDDYVQLAALGAEIHGVFDRITRQTASLTLVQFRALATLAAARPDALEPHEVARAVHIASNHMAKVIGQLEALGLVERRMHEVDRRRRRLTPTAAGVALVEATLPQIDAVQTRMMSEAFTPAERVQLREMVVRLRRTLWELVVPVDHLRPGP
jgi:DNA-binding MarR family transcriptional regulator